MLEFLKDLRKCNDNKNDLPTSGSFPKTASEIVRDQEIIAHQERDFKTKLAIKIVEPLIERLGNIDEIKRNLAGQQPDPLYVPGLDAGIPTGY